MNLDLKNFTDNKKFWRTVKPLFSSGISSQKISLIEDNEVISDDPVIAETFSKFFMGAVRSLNVSLTNIGNVDSVEKRPEDYRAQS